MLLRNGDSRAGGTVAMRVVVSGVLSVGVSTAQHYRLCWPDIQCETDTRMYPYLVLFNCLYVALCNCLFLLVSIFVCLFLSIILFSVFCNDPWDSHGFLLPGLASFVM